MILLLPRKVTMACMLNNYFIVVSVLAKGYLTIMMFDWTGYSNILVV